ncbi:nuclear transport factor 2 family protein [Methylobacterium brachythecii]|uniref:SnoaL-like domain-containing protein n=1 Tax=Methylobacterium brachythecii TaxID=1176177 RepID=A0A7W6AGE6_9HYPH|nr:nuclear transport factor 2 family protein [Methylobacterium brachythecii]MBB3902858.1 hypothetical protein [Methylobacterium brachythecii]GLS43784.1 hypothetical protein GCM10007884_17690 [Methylobacterium brachythecii]
MSNLAVEAPDEGATAYDQLLRANLERIFNERDAAKRTLALAELYDIAPVMYEPTGAVRGQAAISEVAGNLLKQFGPTFRFTADGSAVGHHGLGILRWTAGPDGGPIAVTGADAAKIVGGKIAKLWVLLDQTSA